MDMCRICLEHKKDLCSVFEEDSDISYADMLTTIAKVKIMEDANNNNICLRCRRKLRSLYNFKKEIERSEFKLNQQLKILKFDDIGEVKEHLMNEIKNNVKSIDVDYTTLWQNDCESVLYRDTTIKKIVCHNKCLSKTYKASPDVDQNNYEDDNHCVDFYDDSITWDYKHSQRKKIKQKQTKKRAKDTQKRVKRVSNLKKVCIKPIVLDNIKIIPSKRKLIKTHKEHKKSKRLDICAYCGIMSSNIKTHIRIHIGERKHKCPDCNKAFFTSTLLNYHRSRHLAIEKFKCGQCVAVFNNKGSLLSHMISHKDDKNYVCSICNKSFKRKYTLLRHTLIHNSSAKSVKCELCNMSFLYKQGLRHHMRVHTGERPFKCEICSQPYSYKHDFNRHCLKKHGVFLKQRSIYVMNEEVLLRERALMKDLMLRIQGVVKEGESLNPFQGPNAALAFGEAVKALGSCKIPVDVTL